MRAQVHRRAGVKLTGINKFKGKFHGQPAVICCSGTTLERYNSRLVPSWVAKFAINEAIRKLQNADYWVLSDNQIVLEYARYCPKTTKILCMHEATGIIKRHCPDHEIYTVDSMAKADNYDDGYHFFSRGTVMIGAIEMARFMGFEHFYIFGLDCFRLRDRYYYDRRKPKTFTENSFTENQRVKHDLPPAVRVYVTPRLRKMIEKLKEVTASNLWDGIKLYCVDSPFSQQVSIRKITIDQFKDFMKFHSGRRTKAEEGETGKVVFKKSVSEADWERSIGELESFIDKIIADGGEIPPYLKDLQNKLYIGNREPETFQQVSDVIKSFDESAAKSGEG